MSPSNKTPIIIGAVIATVVLVVVGGAYFSAVTTEKSGSVDIGNPEIIALGKTVYGENCAACHGVNREGQPNWRKRNDDGTLPPPPHDQSGHTWHHPDKVLFQITKLGGQANAPKDFKSAMPAFGETLTDDKIWAVLAYI
ncbi:MAG TPA: c-type cytochrome, partial [Rhodospirillales bacterium]|nr:c-type cytochrome [Rhodospirillales bacterium]